MAQIPAARAPLPDWKRPFENDDFRGFFSWGSNLTARLGGISFYHACHESEAQQALSEGRLGLRSTYSLSHPSYGLCAAPCVWCGLNFFNDGNHYGPILLNLPLKLIEGRTFMVFRRQGTRDRFWFLQYEAGIPIFIRDDKTDQRVNPASYFSKHGEELSFKTNAIYEIVLTQSVPLDDAVIEAVNHPKCVARKCNGITSAQARTVIQTIAKNCIESHLKRDAAMKQLLTRFPDMQGRDIKLPDFDAGAP